MADIFLSYASADRPKARTLVNALGAEGWSLFWDRKIKGGEVFAVVIGKKLADSRCVVVLWSTTSIIQSSWVIEEASEGKKRGILIPTLIHSVKPPFGFRMIHAVDLTSWNGKRDSSSFVELVEAITSKIGPPVPRCGAPTNTGQSCQRRVKSVGQHCWQHQP